LYLVLDQGGTLATHYCGSYPIFVSLWMHQHQTPYPKGRGSLVQFHTQQFTVHRISEAWIWLGECYLIAL